MLWLFRAGVVAALLQLGVLVLVVPGLILLSREGLIGPILVERAGDRSVSPLLSWACLLLALNSAMTNRRIRAQTAARIRRVSAMRKSAAPDEFTHELIAQTSLGVIAMAMLILAAPPDFLLAAAGLVGCSPLAAIGWPALASIGSAWFAAIAFAAREAL
jgi:hypothetical protein